MQQLTRLPAPADILEYSDTEANEMRSLHALVVQFMFEEILGELTVGEEQKRESGGNERDTISYAAGVAYLADKVLSIAQADGWDLVGDVDVDESVRRPDTREDAVQMVTEAMCVCCAVALVVRARRIVARGMRACLC